MNFVSAKDLQQELIRKAQQRQDENERRLRQSEDALSRARVQIEDLTAQLQRKDDTIASLQKELSLNGSSSSSGSEQLRQRVRELEGAMSGLLNQLACAESERDHANRMLEESENAETSQSEHTVELEKRLQEALADLTRLRAVHALCGNGDASPSAASFDTFSEGDFNQPLRLDELRRLHDMDTEQIRSMKEQLDQNEAELEELRALQDQITRVSDGDADSRQDRAMLSTENARLRAELADARGELRAHSHSHVSPPLSPSASRRAPHAADICGDGDGSDGRSAVCAHALLAPNLLLVFPSNTACDFCCKLPPLALTTAPLDSHSNCADAIQGPSDAASDHDCVCVLRRAPTFAASSVTRPSAAAALLASVQAQAHPHSNGSISNGSHQPQKGPGEVAWSSLGLRAEEHTLLVHQLDALSASVAACGARGTQDKLGAISHRHVSGVLKSAPESVPQHEQQLEQQLEQLRDELVSTQRRLKLLESQKRSAELALSTLEATVKQPADNNGAGKNEWAQEKLALQSLVEAARAQARSHSAHVTELQSRLDLLMSTCECGVFATTDKEGSDGDLRQRASQPRASGPMNVTDEMNAQLDIQLRHARAEIVRLRAALQGNHLHADALSSALSSQSQSQSQSQSAPAPARAKTLDDEHDAASQAMVERLLATLERQSRQLLDPFAPSTGGTGKGGKLSSSSSSSSGLTTEFSADCVSKAVDSAAADAPAPVTWEEAGDAAPVDAARSDSQDWAAAMDDAWTAQLPPSSNALQVYFRINNTFMASIALVFSVLFMVALQSGWM